MSFLYISTGIGHFVNADWFVQIMPPYLPFHYHLVYLSGFFEILFGVMLFYSKTSFELEEINPILKFRGYKEAKQKDKLDKLYSRPKITGEQMKSLKLVSEYIKKNNIDEETFEQTEIQIKYQGYIEKEKNNADKLSRLENIKIPKNFNYNKLSSLSFEAKEKLNKIKPMTLSQASRISGIKPSDISVLLVKMGR